MSNVAINGAMEQQRVESGQCQENQFEAKWPAVVHFHGFGRKQKRAASQHQREAPQRSGYDARHPMAESNASNKAIQDFAAERGHVVILTFLATDRCPDVCTAVAQSIRGALDLLPRPVPALAVSVDPAADTPARARAFIAYESLTGRLARAAISARPETMHGSDSE